MRCVIPAGLSLLLLCALPCLAAEETAGLPAFAEVTRGAVAREGFLDTYQKGDHLWLAVPPDRMGKDLLLVPRLDRGIGAGGVVGGLMFDRQAASIVAFERHGDRLFLVKRAHRFTAPDGSPEAAAVTLSIGDSVLQSAPVATMRPDGAVVADVHDWFVSDLSNVDRFLRTGLAQAPDRPGQAALDRSRSHIRSVRAFPQNLEISARLTFVPGEPSTLDSLPDVRFLPLTLYYSFAELPASPMETRAADDRMGYILTVRKDFSRNEDNFFVRYANRWRLEPGEKDGALWRPKKPIVYSIDRTVPERWRSLIQEGILAWNRAFEEAGFKDAVRVEPLPADADPADLRYHTVRWITSDRPDFGAIGPSIVDPRTGEILDADILIEADMILDLQDDGELFGSPAARLARLLHPTPAAAGTETLDFADGLAAQAALLRLALAADGTIAPGAPTPERFLEQSVKWVVMHEVGHTLGLDHNFRASATTPFEKLGDADWTREHGLQGSVLDYPAANLSPHPDGSERREIYMGAVGPYDRWAIAYGYTPDPERARQLARLGAQPGHDYGMEEHLYTPGAIDPTLGIFDLSSDPVAWAAERAGLYRELRERIAGAVLRDNTDYLRLTRSFQTLAFSIPDVLAPAIRSVGGQTVNRDHVGDPGGRPPFVPVSREKQLAALALLDEHLFGERAFALPPDLLPQLGPRHWEHWGEPATWNGRVDVPFAEAVLDIRRTALEALTSPERLSSVRSGELKAGAGAVLTMPELLAFLTERIWTEAWTAPGHDTGPLRRDLQRAWTDRLVKLLTAPPEGTPGDARALARRELRRIDERLAKRLTPPARFDAYTEAHLRDVRERIAQALAGK